MSDHIPDTDEVRFNYTAYESEHTIRGRGGTDENEFAAEFDRWHAEEIRKAKAEQLREFADALAAVPDYAPSHYDQARVDQRHQTVMALLTYADKVEESA